MIARFSASLLGAGAALLASAVAGEVRIAAAANFTGAAREIGAAFEADTGHKAIISIGSTGQLYAQIMHGAPYDVFLAADQARPKSAIAEGLAVGGSRFTYALGKLALFSADDKRVLNADTLKAGDFKKLAIANPETAPYGAAAVEVMTALGAYTALEPKLVEGANVAQAFQFAATGNAELGFVAQAQLTGRAQGAYWAVPAHMHRPVAQDGVLLVRGKDSEAAVAFLAYLMGDKAQAMIRRFGYGVVGEGEE